MFWLILAFGAGIYVGYKYPEQVGKTVDSGKKVYSDIKDKFTKKDTPAQ